MTVDELLRLPHQALREELRRREHYSSLRDMLPNAQVPRRAGTPEEMMPRALYEAPVRDIMEATKRLEKAVYKTDDRVDLFGLQPDDRVRLLFDSVGGTFEAHRVTIHNGVAKLRLRDYASVYGVCSDDPFYGQACGPEATCWLIDEQHVVTAGHVFERTFKSTSSNFAIVFGFYLTDKTQSLKEVPADNVYFGTAATSKWSEDGEDWAVIRLDRPVSGRRPLTLATQDVTKDDVVAVLGHPCRLPLKYAGNAVVTNASGNDRFLATLDAFGGNSGSPVFNDSFEVVGLLAKGEPDWVSLEGCQHAAVYPTTGPQGEEVMRLNLFKGQRP